VNLIPVILDFQNITSKYSLCICLTTPEVSWSLSGDGEDDQGFSYNSVDLDDSRASCVKRVEIRTSPTGSTLEIDADPSGGETSFTLTCYVEAPPTAKSIEGTCSMNRDACIRARFGDSSIVEWTDGPIQVTLRTPPPNARRIILSATGWSAGESASINLLAQPESPAVRWILLNEPPGVPALKLASTPGQRLPLCNVSISRSQVQFVTPTDGYGGSNFNFVAELYFSIGAAGTTDGQCKDVVLWVDYEGAGKITAKLGAQLPRYLSNVRSIFHIT
jgi:hypothetical protein